MEPIDNIDTIPLQEGIFQELEEKKNLSFNTPPAASKEGCGDTRRRCLSENSGGLRALPPKFQTMREKKAIRQSEEIKNLLNNQDILDIRKVKDGYFVLTKDQELFVKINRLPNDIIGPAKFELVPGEPKPR